MREPSVRDQDREGSPSRSSCLISGYSCIRVNIAHVEKEIMLLLVKIMGHIILDRSFYCCYLNNLYLIWKVLKKTQNLNCYKDELLFVEGLSVKCSLSDSTPFTSGPSLPCCVSRGEAV